MPVTMDQLRAQACKFEEVREAPLDLAHSLLEALLERIPFDLRTVAWESPTADDHDQAAVEMQEITTIANLLVNELGASAASRAAAAAKLLGHVGAPVAESCCARCEDNEASEEDEKLFATWRGRIDHGLNRGRGDLRMRLIHEIHEDMAARHPLGIAQVLALVISSLSCEEADADKDAANLLLGLEKDEQGSRALNPCHEGESAARDPLEETDVLPPILGCATEGAPELLGACEVHPDGCPEPAEPRA